MKETYTGIQYTLYYVQYNVLHTLQLAIAKIDWHALYFCRTGRGLFGEGR